MAADVRRQGTYELFETNHGNRILTLDGRDWFAWVTGQRGEILVHSDSDHLKDHTCQQGRYLLVEFEDDPNFQDQPHLFLQNDDFYEEVIVPNSLPDDADPQKKVVRTDQRVARDELERYLEAPGQRGSRAA